MRRFLRRHLNYFLLGFIAVFAVYLFIRFDADDIILGMVIAAGGGILATVVMFYLNRRFPEEPEFRGD
jgi:hypothetical protein